MGAVATLRRGAVSGQALPPLSLRHRGSGGDRRGVVLRHLRCDGVLVNLLDPDRLCGGAVAAFVLFTHFGFVYAGVAATVARADGRLRPGAVRHGAPADRGGGAADDLLRRARAPARITTGFPGDSYAVHRNRRRGWRSIVMTNLKVSPWLSIPDDVPQFYWATYVADLDPSGGGLWSRDSRSASRDARRQHRAGDRHVDVEQAVPRRRAEAVGSDPVRRVADRRSRSACGDGWRAARTDRGSGFVAAPPAGVRAERASPWPAQRPCSRPGRRRRTRTIGPAIGGGGRSGGAGASGKF